MKMKDLCKITVAAFLYDSNFKNHNILGSKTEIPFGWNPKAHKRRLENFEESYEDTKRHATMNNNQTTLPRPSEIRKKNWST